MVRLRHVKTGVIVGVSDEKAKRLDAEWEPVKEPAPKSTEKSTTKTDK